MLNWIADAARFLGAMFYWNIRKTAYVRRGRRGRCPCQNPSDDSIPGGVRCDAMVHWHRPARFQKICPLLVSTPQGWRCSVHAASVRPFWGRVAGWCAAAALLLYVSGTVIGFCGLRWVGGAPVTYAQVAWPGKWPEIRRVQAQHLFQQALAHFAQGRLAEAYRYLTAARERDAGHYPAALVLAQISMFQGSLLFSDSQFEALLRDHPAERGRTLIVYHDTLLQLDRMDKLADLSIAMAKRDPARAALWVRSALLAVRSLPAGAAAGFHHSHTEALAALAPHAQRLLQAEFALRRGDVDAALRTLRPPFRGALNPFYATYQVQRAAEVGVPGDAQVLLDFYGPPLGEFDLLLAQYELSATTRDYTEATATFRRLLRQPLTGARPERILAALIAHPDAMLYHEFSARLRSGGQREGMSRGAALWLTGIVCGAPAEAAYWKTRGVALPVSELPEITAVDFTSRDLAVPNSVARLVNVLNLPREVILALLWRVAPQGKGEKGAVPGRS